ncbi:hypothetical protein ACQEU3_08590 [Spirillospora sp. CA-253888]
MDAYELTVEQESTLRKAQTMLLNDCMRRFKFNGQFTAPPLSPLGVAVQNRRQVLDEEQAKRSGYHRFSMSDGKSDTGPERNGSPPAAARAVSDVMNGTVSSYLGSAVPAGGCVGEAQRKIVEGAPWPKGVQNDQASLGNFVSGLHGQAYQSTQADPRFQQVVKRWSDCMRRFGYAYRKPDDAVLDKRWRGAGVSQTEIKTAVADVRCKKEVNYVGAQAVLQAAYERKLADRNAEALRTVQRLNETRMKNAARVLSGRQPA